MVYTVHTLWLTQSYMLEQKYNVEKLIKLLGKINTQYTNYIISNTKFSLVRVLHREERKRKPWNKFYSPSIYDTKM